MRVLGILKGGRLVLAGILAGSLALSGCVNTVGGGTAVAVKRNDPCLGIRAPFEQLRKERAARIAKWAAGGALAGAAIARASGRRDGKSLLLGAVLGGLAGAAGGYAADVRQRRGATANFRNAVNSDARGDVNSTDRLLRAVSSLNSCRLREVRTVVANQRAGKINAATGKAQLNGILASARQDNRVINSVVSDIDKVQRTYVSALSLEGAANASTYRTSRASYKPKVSNPQRTAKRGTIATKPVQVASRKRTSNQVDSLGYASKELDAGADAHYDSIELAISDAENLFL